MADQQGGQSSRDGDNRLRDFLGRPYTQPAGLRVGLQNAEHIVDPARAPEPSKKYEYRGCGACFGCSQHRHQDSPSSSVGHEETFQTECRIEPATPRASKQVAHRYWPRAQPHLRLQRARLRGATRANGTYTGEALVEAINHHLFERAAELTEARENALKRWMAWQKTSRNP